MRRRSWDCSFCNEPFVTVCGEGWARLKIQIPGYSHTLRWHTNKEECKSGVRETLGDLGLAFLAVNHPGLQSDYTKDS